MSGSNKIVKRYYKLVAGSSVASTGAAKTQRQSVWVSKEEALKNNASEQGIAAGMNENLVRQMRKSERPERLDLTDYVGFVASMTAGKVTRRLTQAVGKDGKLYKASFQEATDSKLPVVDKLQGMKKWYIKCGLKHADESIRKIQKEFKLTNKTNANKTSKKKMPQSGVLGGKDGNGESRRQRKYTEDTRREEEPEDTRREEEREDTRREEEPAYKKRRIPSRATSAEPVAAHEAHHQPAGMSMSRRDVAIIEQLLALAIEEALE
jgi:hypothetical protein